MFSFLILCGLAFGGYYVYTRRSAMFARARQEVMALIERLLKRGE